MKHSCFRMLDNFSSAGFSFFLSVRNYQFYSCLSSEYLDYRHIWLVKLLLSMF